MIPTESNPELIDYARQDTELTLALDRLSSTPSYYPGLFWDVRLDDLLALPWEQHRPTRLECFMSDPAGVLYTYGRGPSAETYESLPMADVVRTIMAGLNADGSDYNGCFLNRYNDEQHHLGWHSDDFARLVRERQEGPTSTPVSKEKST